MKEETKELIEVGSDHLQSSLKSFEIEDYKSACFWAQQAAEFFIKAYLVEKNLFNPKIHKTHNLRKLLLDCMQIDEDFKKLVTENIDILSSYAIRSRYDFGFVRNIKFKKEDAKEAIEIATKIKEFVLNKLK